MYVQYDTSYGIASERTNNVSYVSYVVERVPHPISDVTPWNNPGIRYVGIRIEPSRARRRCEVMRDSGGPGSERNFIQNHL